MPLSEQYQRQVALLVEAIPLVATEADFALKGGTAINLFVRDMPRLSVDIDLVYLPVADRDASLHEITMALRLIQNLILANIPNSKIQESMLPNTNYVVRLMVSTYDTTIKIEVASVLRGT